MRTPWARGFERSFALLPVWRQPLPAPSPATSLPALSLYSEDDRFSSRSTTTSTRSDFYADHAAAVLPGALGRPEGPDRPFFATCPFQAPALAAAGARGNHCEISRPLRRRVRTALREARLAALKTARPG